MDAGNRNGHLIVPVLSYPAPPPPIRNEISGSITTITAFCQAWGGGEARENGSITFSLPDPSPLPGQKTSSSTAALSLASISKKESNVVILPFPNPQQKDVMAPLLYFLPAHRSFRCSAMVMYVDRLPSQPTTDGRCMTEESCPGFPAEQAGHP